jgi:hypothetical protein
MPKESYTVEYAMYKQRFIPGCSAMENAYSMQLPMRSYMVYRVARLPANVIVGLGSLIKTIDNI